MSQSTDSEDRFAELTPFEAAFAALKPSAAEPDRETLFFQAGQAAALRGLGNRPSRLARWGWPAAFSAMTAVAAMLLTMLVFRAEPRPMAPASGPAPEIAITQPGAGSLPDLDLPRSDATAGPATYSRLRDEILANGMDAAWQQKTPAGDSAVAAAVVTVPQSYHDLLNQALHDL
jgi:hypothetical protein